MKCLKCDSKLVSPIHSLISGKPVFKGYYCAACGHLERPQGIEQATPMAIKR